MTQDERWMASYNEVVEFIVNNLRNPSRYRLEEHDMLNWLKANRKKMKDEEDEDSCTDKCDERFSIGMCNVMSNRFFREMSPYCYTKL